jgi:hypothetical protein
MTARSILSMALALVVPGSGHFYLGHRGRAIAFFGIIVVLFVVGLSIDGDLYTIQESRRSLLRILASYGSMGSGVLYFIGKATGPHGSVMSATFEYGRTFTLTAGLMNLLLVLDCFDIASGRKKS